MVLPPPRILATPEPLFSERPPLPEQPLPPEQGGCGRHDLPPPHQDPLRRSLTRSELGHLAPEGYGAPAWRLLGPADAPGGAIGPSTRWGGLVISGPGEALPTLPIGGVGEISASAVPLSGDVWAPGGRSLELSTDRPTPGGLVQVGGPTSRAVAQVTSSELSVDGISARAGAALDLSASSTSALASGTLEQEGSSLELLAAGSQTTVGSELLFGSSLHLDEVGGRLTGVGRSWTTSDGSRTYRVGLGFALDRDEKTGLSAGAEIDHWGFDARLTRRAGAWVQESRGSRFVDLMAALRLDSQDRTGGLLGNRADLSPRALLRLHTDEPMETGLSLGFSREAGSLVPIGEDLPTTDQVLLGLDQVLPGRLVASVMGTLSQDALDRHAAAVDVGLDREGDELSLMVHAAGGAWTSPGALGSPWASAVAMAAWNVKLGLPTRLGLSGRWRSPGEAPAPTGAQGWLPATSEAYADLGGRAVVELPTSHDGQRLELEISGWSRSLQLSVGPGGAPLEDRLHASASRGEAAVRFAW